MDNGEIVEIGSYEMLIKNEGPFSDFIKNHLQIQEPGIKRSDTIEFNGAKKRYYFFVNSFFQSYLNQLLASVIVLKLKAEILKPTPNP